MKKDITRGIVIVVEMYIVQKTYSHIISKNFIVVFGDSKAGDNMNTKAKGSRRERQVRDIMRKRGYTVIKAGGSHGVYDLFAIPWITNREEGACVVGIQVKSGYISRKERQEIADDMTACRKQIWIKQNYKPWKIEEWIDKEWCIQTNLNES